MKIRYYDELSDDYGVLCKGLSLSAFWGVWSDKITKLERRLNPYLSKEFAIFAVEGKKIMGQVKMYEIPIETLEGREVVGGIAGVLSNPQYSRAGNVKLLMERSHEIFLEKGLRFSFLCTGRSLVGYNLYKKLDYEDIADHPIGVRCLPKKRRPKSKKLTKCKSYKEGKAMFELHQEYVKGLLGFIHRPPDFFTWRIKHKIHLDKGSIVFLRDRKKKMLGYAVKSKRNDVLYIDEIIAPAEKDFTQLLYGMLDKDVNEIVAWGIMNPTTQKRLAKLGFTIFDRTWGDTMALDLKGKLRRKDIKKLVGIPGRYNFFAMDGF